MRRALFIGVACVIVVVVIVAVVVSVRSVTNSTLVRVAADCTGAGRSPSGESASCAGTPRVRMARRSSAASRTAELRS
jgi:hypothetical protein